MHSHEIYDSDALNVYIMKSLILLERYMTICAVVRGKAFIGCSSGADKGPQSFRWDPLPHYEVQSSLSNPTYTSMISICRPTKIVSVFIRHSTQIRGLAICSRQSRFSPRTLITHHLRKYISSSSKAFDPYSYSGGHWLHRDEQRQKARRLEFNFDALLDVAVKHCEGAREVVACEKKEDGFNRVFVIHLDNGAKVVAKVPMRYAGPAALMTMSEVATMRYGIWHLYYWRVGH